jgi:hypothetical protein
MEFTKQKTKNYYEMQMNSRSNLEDVSNKKDIEIYTERKR